MGVIYPPMQKKKGVSTVIVELVIGSPQASPPVEKHAQQMLPGGDARVRAASLDSQAITAS